MSMTIQIDTRGLYGKFDVRRRDGKSEPGAKHDGCVYFVLDLDHDPHSVAALRAYADDCEATRPELAHDLRAWINAHRTPAAFDERARLVRQIKE